MGLMDLLLKKGRGVGELKTLRHDYHLNANIIQVIKQLSDIDKKASSARSSKNLSLLFSCIKNQISLIEQVHHFALVRTVRLQYDYKEIEEKISEYEKHYKNELKKLHIEEIKLRKKGKSISNAEQIRQHINKTRNDLDNFHNKIKNFRTSLKEFKKSIKEKSKNKIIKIKKIYHFT